MSRYGQPAVLRHPDIADARLMRRRAWWLLVLNFVIPGSPQIVAGNRRLGRIGLATTLCMWVIAMALLVIALVNQSVLIGLFTHSAVLVFVQVVIVIVTVIWVVLTINTLRLLRLGRVQGRSKAALAVVLAAALVAGVGVSTYAFRVANVSSSVLASVFTNDRMVAPVDGRYNIMVLGGDAGKGREGLRPDSLTVVSVEASSGRTALIGVPRNLEIVPFSKGSPMYKLYPNGYDCGDNCLIDYLYTEGMAHKSLYPDATKHGSSAGIEAMRDALEGVTGLTIQYYVLIDMQGFANLIDAVGGVKIDVKQRLNKRTDTGVSHGYIEAGTQVMDGATALWYARVRAGSSDYDRMRRQRQVQMAIIQQIKPSVLLTRFQDIAKAGKQIVETDIPESALGGFVTLAGKSRTQPITRLELTPQGTVPIRPAYPNYQQIHSLVQKALRAASAPTGSPSPSSR